MSAKKTKLVPPWEQDPVCKSGKPRKEACVCPPARPVLSVPISTLAKLGSIAVHADEMMSDRGHHFDKVALEQLLRDPEVTAWLKSMDPFVPRKR